jgi:hypothetical protein
MLSSATTDNQNIPVRHAKQRSASAHNPIVPSFSIKVLSTTIGAGFKGLRSPTDNMPNILLEGLI